MSAAAARRRGALFVIAAPSGAGKTSLVKAVLDARSIAARLRLAHHAQAARDRSARPRLQLRQRRRVQAAASTQDEFLEHAQVFDNFYGTGRAQVEALRNAGHDVILEIDWQGAQQVRKAQPDCKTVFILPPSRAELETRLRNRKTDSDAGHRTPPAGCRGRYVALRGVRLRHRQRRFRDGGGQLLAILRGGGTEYGAQKARSRSPCWPTCSA